MSYRYNTIDIIVGIGMCAILFGALLLFLAVNGSYQALPPYPLQERSATLESGVQALQPTLGRAIVDHTIIERQSNQDLAQSVSEWNRISMSYHDWQAGSGSWLGTTLTQGMTVPTDHLARVQRVMGQAIVNFTKRGVRNGLLSAAEDATPYNMRMIHTVKTQGQRMHNEFASTWQGIIGHRIIEAALHDWDQAGAIQERLGSTLVQVAHAQMNLERRQMAQQEQLASLIVAAVRSHIPADLITPTGSASEAEENVVIASAAPTSWPEIPMRYLMVAGILLTIVLLGGLSMAARGREMRALAQMRHDTDRWVFRMAA